VGTEQNKRTPESRGGRGRSRRGRGAERPPAPRVPAGLPAKRTLVFPLVEAPERARVDLPAPAPGEVPSERPSERPTLPTLPPIDDPSSPVDTPSSSGASQGVVELGTSALVLDEESAAGESAERDGRVLTSLMKLPRWVVHAMVARRVTSRVALVGLVVVALSSAFAADDASPSRREGRVPADARARLVLARPVPEAPAPGSGACVVTGRARLVGERAELGPGLDVAALELGFGVGFAARPFAHGVRLDGAFLHVAERLRLAASAPTSVAIHAPGDEALGLHVEEGSAQVVFPEDGHPFRIFAKAGWLRASALEGGAGERVLWALPPHGPAATKTRRAAEREILRAEPRDTGGAAVVLRRPQALWVGLADGALGPESKLMALDRPGATLGTPRVTGWGGGGAVVWAERPKGSHEWIVMVGSFTPDGDAPTVHAIGAGMSPALVPTPDGDLLVAHAVGSVGAHRVVLRRLGPDLGPRGEPVVISTETPNAGQPAVAIAADGRALVAFFAAERGRPASVHAVPLACDSGI
jgi:hypothetical protein